VYVHTKIPDKTSFLVCAILCTMSAVPFISGLVHQHQSDCIPSSMVGMFDLPLSEHQLESTFPRTT